VKTGEIYERMNLNMTNCMSQRVV